jgi:hypothetical protein
MVVVVTRNNFLSYMCFRFDVASLVSTLVYIYFEKLREVLFFYKINENEKILIKSPFAF